MPDRNYEDDPKRRVTGPTTPDTGPDPARVVRVAGMVPCFTPGTRIATPRGEVAVEALHAGDRVITRDNGLQPVRWTGTRRLTPAEFASAPHLRPVIVRAGALGNGWPARDMCVSPTHRLLLVSERAALYFGEREVLAAARDLTGMDGIARARPRDVSYVHFLCDRHEIVLSDEAWTESLQPEAEVLDAMGATRREEIFALFPDLRDGSGLADFRAARRALRRREARLVLE